MGRGAKNTKGSTRDVEAGSGREDVPAGTVQEEITQTTRESSRSRARRERSRDWIPIFDSRLALVEEKAGDLGDQLEELESKVDTLGVRSDRLEEEVPAIHESLSLLLSSFKAEVRDEFGSELAKQREVFKKELHEAHDQIEGLGAELASMRVSHEHETDIVLEHLENVRKGQKSGVPSGPVAPTPEARPIDAPKPRSFGGTRNARDIDNFLWGMDQYFEATGVDNESVKIRTAALYLTDTAMLWWRRRRGDIEKGTCSITTFAEFKRDLKRQFYPEDAEEEAWSRLRNLKQKGSIRDYVKEFTTLILEVSDLSDKEALRYFKDGLQMWAKTELKRRGAPDLASAIATAEGLVDYMGSGPAETRPSTGTAYPAKSGGETPQRTEPSYGVSFPRPRDKGKAKESARSPNRSSDNRCFLCGGPHWSKNCPQKAALSSVSLIRSEAPGKGEARLGSMQLLNAMHSTPQVQAKGLHFVDTTIKGQRAKAMLDTGATHNFLSKEEAARLGVKGTYGESSVKAVNSPAKRILGVAKGVETRVGTWVGKLDFAIVAMDDIKVIFGLAFHDQAKAFMVPINNTMCIMGGKKECVVPTTRSNPCNFQVLSTMQLKEGLRNPSPIPKKASKSRRGRRANECGRMSRPAQSPPALPRRPAHLAGAPEACPLRPRLVPGVRGFSFAPDASSANSSLLGWPTWPFSANEKRRFSHESRSFQWTLGAWRRVAA
ncbi:unnamed protein product [Rhodiola kirilowii]